MTWSPSPNNNKIRWLWQQYRWHGDDGDIDGDIGHKTLGNTEFQVLVKVEETKPIPKGLEELLLNNNQEIVSQCVEYQQDCNHSALPLSPAPLLKPWFVNDLAGPLKALANTTNVSSSFSSHNTPILFDVNASTLVPWAYARLELVLPPFASPLFRPNITIDVSTNATAFALWSDHTSCSVSWSVSWSVFRSVSWNTSCNHHQERLPSITHGIPYPPSPYLQNLNLLLH